MITIYYLAMVRRSKQYGISIYPYTRSKPQYLHSGYKTTWSIHTHDKSYTHGKRFTSCRGSAR